MWTKQIFKIQNFTAGCPPLSLRRPEEPFWVPPPHPCMPWGGMTPNPCLWKKYLQMAPVPPIFKLSKRALHQNVATDEPVHLKKKNPVSGFYSVRYRVKRTKPSRGSGAISYHMITFIFGDQNLRTCHLPHKKNRNGILPYFRLNRKNVFCFRFP